MVAMVPGADWAASCVIVTSAGADGGPTRASGCEDTHSESPIALRARARTVSVAGKPAKTGTNTCRRYILVTGKHVCSPQQRGRLPQYHPRPPWIWPNTAQQGAQIRVQGIVEAA